MDNIIFPWDLHPFFLHYLILSCLLCLLFLFAHWWIQRNLPREYGQAVWITHSFYTKHSWTTQASCQKTKNSLGNQISSLSLEVRVQVGMCCSLPGFRFHWSKEQMPISFISIRPGFKPTEQQLPNMVPSSDLDVRSNYSPYTVLLFFVAIVLFYII